MLQELFSADKLPFESTINLSDFCDIQLHNKHLSLSLANAQCRPFPEAKR